MDWKWEVVSLVCSTHTPFHDKARDNGDGTFTHTLTPKQESAYVAGWRKITSLSDLNWPAIRYEKHHWVLTPCGRWCCQRCGKEEIGTPDQDSPCQPNSDHPHQHNWHPTPSGQRCYCGWEQSSPSSETYEMLPHKWKWDGKRISCTACGLDGPDAPKTCALTYAAEFSTPPKTHDICLDHDFYCRNCGIRWGTTYFTLEELENEVCEGPHAEYSTQHSRREGTHSR